MTDKENSFEKDINSPSKEQIIIDGEKEDCKILFRCNHIDDLAAYNMIRNGIKITPENAPIGDFELMLIENTDSPFGFSSVCKRNNKEDVWEYSGFGHSGACSIVTALLKRLARKTQECESLKEEIEVLKDNFDTATRDCNELIEELKQECEELKERLERTEEDLKYQCVDCMNVKSDRYRKTLEEIEKYTKKYFCENCEDFNTPEYSSHCEFCEYQEYFDIINKAKDGEF